MGDWLRGDASPSLPQVNGPSVGKIAAVPSGSVHATRVGICLVPAFATPWGAWRIVEPVLGTATPVAEYEPRTWGPAGVAELIAGDGPWHDPVTAGQSR